MNETTHSDSRIIVALDFPNAAAALELVDRLEPGSCRLKVGKELFTRAGPALVGQLQQRGFDVFLDLKFHDIPNTVGAACRAAAELGVWMLNVHALGGERMLVAAREAIEQTGHSPLLIAVTILTSMEGEDLETVGLGDSAEDNVLRLASLAQEAGLDGVVCSPRETPMLRKRMGDGILLVTPGIRPAGAASNDQRRIMTPVDAVTAGSSYLVIGRPVTQADDPVAVIRTINSELAAVG